MRNEDLKMFGIALLRRGKKPLRKDFQGFLSYIIKKIPLIQARSTIKALHENFAFQTEHDIYAVKKKQFCTHLFNTYSFETKSDYLKIGIFSCLTEIL